MTRLMAGTKQGLCSNSVGEALSLSIYVWCFRFPGNVGDGLFGG